MHDSISITADKSDISGFAWYCVVVIGDIQGSSQEQSTQVDRYQQYGK